MIESRDHYGFALHSIRDHVRDGIAAPGAQLVVVEIAKRLRISPTPVREALCELSGEGLIEIQRGRGFYVRRLEASDIAELYQLHRLFIVDRGEVSVRGSMNQFDLRMAADRTDGRIIGRQFRTQFEQVFRKLRQIGGAELDRGHCIVADRISAARIVEVEVFRRGKRTWESDRTIRRR